MAESFTEGLRHVAPHWSLAGDKQLLDVLQGLHQKIIEKCQETNRNLEKMVTSLDEANIQLQNVNNKFTALSNSQFVESRVYDDDGEELTKPEKPKEETEPMEESEWERINRGLQVLERMHESVSIVCDSDSDSGTDDEDVTRVVLKPKDLYAHRPLPYIIGSKAWKSKWHAGLLPDESDSDSASVKETANNEEYSDSEPEPASESPRHYAKAHARHSPTISSSSDIESEQEGRSPLAAAVAPPRPSQSDVAAELARRLGAGTAKLADTEPEAEPPSPTVRKLYKPHQPMPGNVFLDEPPPIDSDQSEDVKDDIFAEINRKQPYRQSNKADNSVADDLFGRPVFDEVPPVNPPAKQKQLLFEEESEPELFAEQKPAPESKMEQDIGVKKPVGAMSLFGSKANAESIGAAILKRNRRRSTSGEESDQEPAQTANNIAEPVNNTKETERDAKTQKEKERDIFEDLFVRSERMNKEKKRSNVKDDRKVKEEVKKAEKKPDLFSDNIFDDIDDIFTTNVKIIPKDDKKQIKSIFDDDDDLFAEVSAIGKSKNDASKADFSSKRDIFGDEDDIFSDKPPEINNVINKSIKETKSLFDDSDDELFLDGNKTSQRVAPSVNVTKSESTSNVVFESVKAEKVDKGLFSDDDILFKNANNIPSIEERTTIEDSSKTLTEEKKIDTETSKQPSKVVVSPDIFDEDDYGLFLFQSTQSVSTKKHVGEETSRHDNNLSLPENIKQENTNPSINTKKEEDVISKSTKSIFSDEDTEDDIFSKPLQNSKVNDNIKDSTKVGVNKSTEGPINPSINRQDVETEIMNKLDQTIIETTVRTTKPKISEKPLIADVTVINTRITVVPNSNTDPLASQDAISADTTVTDNKITVMPEIHSVTAPNATVNEVEVSIKPGIAQKPILAKKPIHNEELQKKDKAIIPDNMKTVDANKNFTDTMFQDISTEEVLINNEKNTPSDPPDTKTDLFSDIFNDQPPLFEKPKEPKKSKNVNALFDDDSDDESLFFKKNDVIPDERPEGFISSDDKLFGLFRDEPPAIDVDFIQKSNKTDKLPKADKNSSHNDEKLSQTNLSTIKINTAGQKDAGISEKNMKLDDDNDIIFSSKTKKLTEDLNTNSNTEDLFSKITDDIFRNPSVEDDDDLFKTLKKDDSKLNFKEEKNEVLYKSDNENIDNTNNVLTGPKKVGKLKPMNFNINVNTLLPGASPKKIVKSSDNTDGQTPSRSTDELYNDAEIKNTEIEPTLVKSVSFEGNPDSSVLDNKFSKERAKIQVKRRPSTRRARREAVKNSGINFGDDSTDNSSSVDDQPKSDKEISNHESVVTAKNETVDFEDIIIASEIDMNVPIVEKDTMINVANINDSDLEGSFKSDKDINIQQNININTVNFNDIVTSGDLISQGSASNQSSTLENQANFIFNSKEDVRKEDVKQESETDTSLEQKHVCKPSTEDICDAKDVKSKLVYILNDEDIFNTKADQKPETSQSVSKLKDNIKSESVVNDPDDLFNVAKNEGITTLGKVYESKTKTQKLDFLSDSDDDDNLFKSSIATKEVKSVEKKETSDTNKVEVRNVALKSKSKPSPFGDSDDIFEGKTQEKSKKPSLFGSDSDEELFSGHRVKKEREIPQKKQEAKKEDIRKQVKKASLFEDDGDDDLFGVKIKKNEAPKPQAAKKKEELSSIHPEPVFADPLSLLGSDEE